MHILVVDVPHACVECEHCSLCVDVGSVCVVDCQYVQLVCFTERVDDCSVIHMHIHWDVPVEASSVDVVTCVEDLLLEYFPVPLLLSREEGERSTESAWGESCSVVLEKIVVHSVTRGVGVARQVAVSALSDYQQDLGCVWIVVNSLYISLDYDTLDLHLVSSSLFHVGSFAHDHELAFVSVCVLQPIE